MHAGKNMHTELGTDTDKFFGNLGRDLTNAYGSFTIDFARMRLGLTTALMTDAYFAYDVGTVWYGLPFWYGEYAAPLDAPVEASDAMPVRVATQLYNEFRHLDGVSALAVQGLMLELLAETSRRSSGATNCKPPRWLEQVKEELHARFQENLSLAELAASAGVHAVHLARSRNVCGGHLGDALAVDVGAGHARESARQHVPARLRVGDGVLGWSVERHAGMAAGLVQQIELQVEIGSSLIVQQIRAVCVVRDAMADFPSRLAR